MDNYKDDLEEMGIKSYDKGTRLNNLFQFGATIIKNRRNNVNNKASQLGLDPIGSVYAADEGIYDGMLNQEGNIEREAYQSQFNEADFVSNQKLKKQEMQLKDAQIDELNGSWLDDVLGIGNLATGLLDVTGLGKNIFGSLFGKNKK